MHLMCRRVQTVHPLTTRCLDARADRTECQGCPVQSEDAVSKPVSSCGESSGSLEGHRVADRRKRMLTGALIIESLRVGAVLDSPDLTVRRLSRAPPPNVTSDHPPVWTLLEFTSGSAGPRSARPEIVRRARLPRVVCQFRLRRRGVRRVSRPSVSVRSRRRATRTGDDLRTVRWHT